MKIVLSLSLLNIPGVSNMALYCLIYSGVSTRVVSDVEFKAMRETACFANLPHDVTGILFHSEKLYLQLTKGLKSKIKQLYQNLCLFNPLDYNFL